MIRVVLLGAALLGLVACAPETATRFGASTVRLAPDVPADYADAAWCATTGDQQVVARVNGAPITLDLLNAVTAATPDLTPQEALDRLVELEVLAQDAMTRGLHKRPDVADRWREALAQRFLRDGFEAETRPSDLSLERVAEIYRIPRIRKLYDHADAWRMAHLFFSCCDPKVERCDKPDVVQCFGDAGREILTVYEQAKRACADAEGDPDALIVAMKAFRKEVELRWPQLAFRERGFYYDPKKPHDQQKGYTIIAEAVSRTVIEAPLAVLQEPVQSPFGFHVIAKLGHDPEQRKGPTAPDVVADIRKNAFPEFRRARFGRLIDDLRVAHTVQVKPEVLDLTGESQP